MLDDKYRIEHLLAVGGMGAVYVGTHIKLRKRVAIKVLNPQLSSPAMVERFHREAITASQIGHEGIAQVTDIGTSTEGEPFLVMEYLEGESLAGRLKTSGPLPIDIACELGCSILAPLEAAHRAGIVHRDLKPDNVFLVRQSRGEMIKLLDFGISRSQGLEGEFRLTTTGLVLGTPYYMSPEQARGDAQLTLAADLYAFGVIMYEMLIGHVPIQGENYNQLMYRVMTADFVRPRQVRPDLPEALEQVILQAMALEPTHRPASAAQLEQMLLAFCRPTFREHTIERLSAQGLNYKQSSPSIGAAGPNTGTDRTVLATPTGAPALTQAPANRSRGLLIAFVAVAIIGGGAIAVVALSGGNGGSATATPVPSTVEPPSSVGTPSEPATTMPTPTTIVGESPPTPTPTAEITIKFVVMPKTAIISLDGKTIDADLTVPADDREHTLSISAKGYESHTETIKLDVSQRLSYQLPKLASVRPTGKDRPTGKTPPGGKDPNTNRIDTQSPYKQ